MPDRSQLLKILSDGRFHSGEEIGRELGVSRAAVWKSLRDLEAFGLLLQAVSGRGYRLAAPLELLSVPRIKDSLSGQGRGLLAEPEILFSVDSTNSHMMRRALEGAPCGSVCLAEFQSAGRGRRGRPWVSPFGSNLYLSLLWRFADGAGRLMGLSLAVAVAVAEALVMAGVDGIGVKWPNDIYRDGRKLAGILIDLAGEATGNCHVVIGVGINVAMPGKVAETIDQPWADLSHLPLPVGRNRLAGLLLEKLAVTVDRFSGEGFDGVRSTWQSLDLLADRSIRLSTPSVEIKGVARGVDRDGALLVETCDGIRRFASGEVSVRSEGAVLK